MNDVFLLIFIKFGLSTTLFFAKRIYFDDINQVHHRKTGKCENFLFKTKYMKFGEEWGKERPNDGKSVELFSNKFFLKKFQITIWTLDPTPLKNAKGHLCKTKMCDILRFLMRKLRKF